MKKNNGCDSLTFVSFCGEGEAYPTVSGHFHYFKKCTDLPTDFIVYSKGWRYLKNPKKFFKLLGLFYLLLAIASVCIKVTIKKPKTLYLAYPSFIAAPFIRALGYSGCVVLDAFISIYDTVVIDRNLLSTSNPIAKLLFRFEKWIYQSATVSVVDTNANKQYLTDLFSLPCNKFQAAPIPITLPETQNIERPKRNEMSILFIGTFVPLQGTEVIFSAIELLQDDPRFEFKIVGYGQDVRTAELIYSRLRNKPIWIKTWQTLAEIHDHLIASDICLGIFGKTAKTQRVWPIKNYMYMATAKPLITLSTSCAREMTATCTQIPCSFITDADPRLLADAIRALGVSGEERSRLGNLARAYFQAHLSPDFSHSVLCSIIRKAQKYNMEKPGKPA